MSKPLKLELDKLDLMLAKELELDARQSNRVLARKLATSEPTVKRRVQRLMDEGLISIVTIPDRVSLGFPIGLTIGLHARPGKAGKLAEHLLPYKSIQVISLTTGRYDILISTVFRDIHEQNEFLNHGLGRVPYLIGSEPIIMLQGIKASWKYLNDVTDRYQEPTRRDLDKLDIELIKELELCPRESIIKLGRKIAVNRNVTSKRLRSLLADRIVQVVSIAEPPVTGFNVHAFIFMKARPDKVTSVANSLISEKAIHRIHIIAGRFNLFVMASFRDIEALSDLASNRLGNYPGIISHETMIQIGVTKLSYSLLS